MCRILIRTVFAFAVISTAGIHWASAAERRDVLSIAIDDLNDWVGHLGGYPGVKTPHLDALAKRGVSFTNAHCVAPACNPSRAGLLSGLMEVPEAPKAQEYRKR